MSPRIHDHAIIGNGRSAALVTRDGVVDVGLPALPGLHPCMAGETEGPTVVRQLEPPGFLAMHYGIRTPLSVLLAHVVYGAILGAFY